MRWRRSSTITSRSEAKVSSREAQIAHAVGFHAHDQLEPVARDALVIGGVVPGRERVVLAAIAGDGAREFARRDLARALEHQVFEEVRDAGMAARLVSRADAIPDHVRDHRRAAIGDHHDLHAVAEREGFRPRQFARVWRDSEAANAATAALAATTSVA